MIHFNVNPNKALETIVYLANKKEDLDHYHLVKTIFYADKMHLNNYGRPILGDVYKKMKAGPVPSLVLDLINCNSFMLSPDLLQKSIKAFEIVQKGKQKLVKAKRNADLDEFSQTDIECLDHAFKLCSVKSGKELCNATHEERSWIAAELNGDMDYALFLNENNPLKDDIIQDLKENSSSMVF